MNAFPLLAGGQGESPSPWSKLESPASSSRTDSSSLDAARRPRAAVAAAVTDVVKGAELVLAGLDVWVLEKMEPAPFACSPYV